MMNTIAQRMAMQTMKDVWYRIENEIHNENEMCESVRPTHPTSIVHTTAMHKGTERAGERAESLNERA